MQEQVLEVILNTITLKIHRMIRSTESTRALALSDMNVDRTTDKMSVL